MDATLTIVGYSEQQVCQHCGKTLKHGIRIDDGRVVGAQCFANVLTQKVEYRGKFYRLTPDVIVRYAKAAEYYTAEARSRRFGIEQSALTFNAA